MCSGFIYCCDNTSIIISTLKLNGEDNRNATARFVTEGVIPLTGSFQPKEERQQKVQQFCKKPCDGDGLDSQLISHNGNNNNDHNHSKRSDSNLEPDLEDSCLPPDTGTTESFLLSEEAETLFEAIFTQRMTFCRYSSNQYFACLLFSEFHHSRGSATAIADRTFK